MHKQCVPGSSASKSLGTRLRVMERRLKGGWGWSMGVANDCVEGGAGP